MAPGIYDMQNKSLVMRMIPAADQLCLANLKLQQAMIKAVPDGVEFDIDALDGVITSMGEGTKPTEILRMYQQTGSFAYSGTRADGTPINNKVVNKLTGGLGAAFQGYIIAKQHFIQEMNEVIGFNSAVDASTPNTESLVGVQKMAAQATQNALRPIYNAHIRLIEKSIKRVALMIQDSMEFNEEAFKMALGQQAAATIKHGRKIAANQFAIVIEIAPDEEDRIEINNLIALGLQSLTLNPSDAIRIRQELKYSTKLASQLLVLLEAKNKKEKQKESQMLQEQNGQIQQQSAQVAEQAKTQSAMAINQAEMEKMQLEYRLKNEFATAQLQRDLAIEAAKGQNMSQVAMINNDGKEGVQASANYGKLAVEGVKHESKMMSDENSKKESSAK